MGMQISELNFLVAEDHDFQRRTLVRMLGGLGANNVADAADGKAALDIFRDLTHRIDIIISDLEMPGMDGLEFIRHVGATGVPVSVILSSALDPTLVSSVETMTKAYGITLLGAIEKPVTPQKLEALIRKYTAPKPKAAKPAGPASPLEEIRQGLKNAEVVPFFQPKVRLADGTVTGAEALARWLHPQRGIVAPYAFIGPLEENGLIDNLTWMMLEKSANLCRDWTASGLDVTVSVNLTLASLNDPGLADHITEIVQGQRLDPRRMILEVTESTAMTDVGRALENLARLRMKGFGLSIDDYGTGYSSMQRLTRIPFTELKIDQNFVKNAATQDVSRAVVESSLEMAKKLGISAVAEGVENRRDFDLVRSLGCDLVQGYYVSRPMEAGQFQNWVTARAQDCA